MRFQAWAYTKPPFPSTLALVDVTPPDQLGPTELLVEVFRTGLDRLSIQLANAPIFKLPQLAYPKGLGVSFSGKVISKGAEVTKFGVGDEIFGLSFAALGKPMESCLSQIFLADSSSAVILRKPAALSWEEAAAFPFAFLTAWTALSAPYTLLPTPFFDDPEKPTIVVLGGATPVGIFAVQLAVRLGARVLATSTPHDADFVVSLGAEETIDNGVDSIRDRLLTIRPPDGFLAVVDCVGGTELLEDWSVLSALLTPRTPSFRAGGCYVTVVGDGRERSLLPGALLYLWYPRMLLRRIASWVGWCPRYALVDPSQDSALLEEGIEMFDGDLVIPIDSRWEFEHAKEGFARLESGQARGQVLIVVKKET